MFDLSGLSGATVSSATFRVYQYNYYDTSSRPIAVHRVTSKWSETNSYCNGTTCE